MPSNHLNEKQFMQLVEAATRKGTFFKKANLTLSGELQELIDHLLECRYCLHDLWQCYLTYESLAEEEKKPSQARIRLSLSGLANQFSVEKLGGLLFNSGTILAPAVRASQEDEKPLCISADYDMVLPSLPGTVFRIQFKATTVALECVIHSKQTENALKQIQLYRKKTGKENEYTLLESQSINTLEDKSVFMVTEKSGTYQFKLNLQAGENLTLLEIEI